MVIWEKNIDGQNKRSTCGRRANERVSESDAHRPFAEQPSPNATSGVCHCATPLHPHEGIVTQNYVESSSVSANLSKFCIIS